MPIYTIADMIHEARKRLGYSQSQLSQELCSVTTISRIENNAQIPSKKLFDLLMRRLGRIDSFYTVFVSKEEMERRQLCLEIISMIGNSQFDSLEDKVEEFEAMSEGNEPQIVLLVKAALKDRGGGDPGEVLSMLLAAIRMTLPGFELEREMEQGLLTFDEIAILHNIAICRRKTGKEEQAINLLRWLKKHMESHMMDGEEKAKLYTAILSDLADWLGSSRRYQESLELCELGIDVCIRCGKLTPFASLMFRKACNLAELGDGMGARDFFQKSYYIYMAMDHMQKSQEIRSYALEHCQIDIIGRTS